MNGLSRKGPEKWMERATISFPVPLSPRMSTGWLLWAALPNAIELLHLRRPAYDAAETQFRFDLLPQGAVFGFQFQVVGHTLQQQPQFLHAEGLGHVVIGAILHGLDRGLDGAVS